MKRLSLSILLLCLIASNAQAFSPWQWIKNQPIIQWANEYKKKAIALYSENKTDKYNLDVRTVAVEGGKVVIPLLLLAGGLYIILEYYFLKDAPRKNNKKT